MLKKIVILCSLTLALVVLSLFCTEALARQNPEETDSLSNGIQESLVTAEWLHKHLHDPRLVVLDTTVQIDFDDAGALMISSGLTGYKSGHIPTAGFADLTSDLVDTTSDYPYALPTPEKFASAMAKLGVGDDSYVVLYARDYSAWATRVWWMLRWIGFDNAAVLDGGLNAWTSAGFSSSIEPATAYKTNNRSTEPITIALRPHLIADRDEVFAAINNDNVVLIDAMPAAHYSGEMVMYGRAGHIPSAVNIPDIFAEDGSFLPANKLSSAHPFEKNKRVITYCGGGISASANAFAMYRLGFTDVAVYINSLNEWASNPDNPLVTTSD